MAAHFLPPVSDILPSFSSTPFLAVSVAVFLLFWALGLFSRFSAHKLPYPPGPPPKDFISRNARELLASQLWFTMMDWAEKYGRIMYLKSFNTHMIVLNSFDDAIELLEKRANNYSDRPDIPMIDLVGWTFTTAFKPYGPAWHAHRRLMQQTFRPTASLKYKPIQVEKVNDMLHSLLELPEDFMNHIKTLSVSIVMSAMYGYKVSPQNDLFQEIAEIAMTALSNASYPGAAIVNILPILRFLPGWFPGAGFHHVARIAKATVTRMQEVPYKYVQDNLAAGTAKPSFVASFIDTCKTEEDHTLLKAIAATGYAAGADTTTSSLGTFIYAMAIFPDIQRKAQEEVDRVVGSDRVPNYDDEGSLPYVQALCREVFRWRPVLPLGVFHSAIAEDVFDGYYIPERYLWPAARLPVILSEYLIKGTTIVPNVWAMTRDPVRYKNPEEFNPDRFFDENNKLNGDDMAYTFGFGRRICPGRHLASATVWLAVATILSAFDIRPAKDASGNDIPLTNVEYTGGLISHPLPFKCVITPRSTRMKQLIVDLHSSSA